MDRITEMPITMLAHHPKNPRLDLGYEPSDEEQQIMDGTHPLYKWEEEDE